MMKALLLILSGLLIIYVLSSNAECDVPGKNKGTETTPLHHIIEFGKRSQIGVKGCENKTHTKSNATKLRTVLGLHGLLHVKSQHTKQETGSRRQSDSSVTGETIFKNVNDDVQIKGTDEEQKTLHKLRLRAETISMLHKIVDKYFPGGHLTVDQKIKALKILGKLIKLKKEGKTADLKAILNSLSKKNHNNLILKTEENSKLKTLKNTKDKTVKDKDADNDGGKSGGDIYATIANGPDIPKLPPSVNAKDPDHAHSNIMPVGFQPRGGGGDFMNSMGQPNDISDDLRDSLTAKMGNYGSQYSNGEYPGTSLGMGQIYNNGNRMSLSDMPMMNAPGYARSRMPFAPRYRRIGSYDDGRRYNDDGNDDDDGDDDDDDDDDEEIGRTRSYVHRHDDDDNDDDEDDSDDNDEVEYSRHFDRKDKIAKNPTKGNAQRKSKKKNAKRLAHH